MRFAVPLPWWLALLAVTAILAFALATYRRPLVPLSPTQRFWLTALRAAALLVLLALICRPVIILPPLASGQVVVPVLIDVSRSMRIQDAGESSRLARAIDIARAAVGSLSPAATVELLAFSDRLESTTFDSVAADGRRTDIRGAIDATRTRYRGRRVAGVLLLSDGGDAIAPSSAAPSEQALIPVFPIGVGAPDGVADREVTGLTASDARIDQAGIELRVTAVSRGFGTEPFQLNVLADGQVVETRRVMPAVDGTPLDEQFTIFPDASRASYYTAAIEAAKGEQVTENNTRSVALGPAGPRRRVLLLAGAPGYDYSFLVRALQQDPALDVDSVVRKGKDDANQDTFLVQAGGGRAAFLAGGFPGTREALFAYDAIVVANLESDFFSNEQLIRTAAFVSERGGGLLVMGGRSFERRGLMATPLEEVLPVESAPQRGGFLPGATDDKPTRRDTMVLTTEGVQHPVMRIGRADQLKSLWATLPLLASSAPLGRPRAGASVLATISANGAQHPIVAVQRYGRGRAMVFGGEASWRWRMLQPAADRRYELFWRQAARWLASDSPPQVSLVVPPALQAGDSLTVSIDIRDRSFAPVDGAEVEVRVTSPTGATTAMVSRPDGVGQAVASGALGGPGLYHVQAEARKAGVSFGGDDRWVTVADAEREFADPRLNEGTLRRVARESGGRYAAADQAGSIIDALAKTVPGDLVPQERELWHEPWTFALVVLLLSAEWVSRRFWGLR